MNIVSLIVSEATVVETRTQNTGITTIGVEMVNVPTMDIVRRGILIRFVAKLGSGSSGVSMKRKLNGSLALPITTTRITGTP
jgi:hypothetical protein